MRKRRSWLNFITLILEELKCSNIDNYIQKRKDILIRNFFWNIDAMVIAELLMFWRKLNSHSLWNVDNSDKEQKKIVKVQNSLCRTAHKSSTFLNCNNYIGMKIQKNCYCVVLWTILEQLLTHSTLLFVLIICHSRHVFCLLPTFYLEDSIYTYNSMPKVVKLHKADSIWSRLSKNNNQCR